MPENGNLPPAVLFVVDQRVFEEHCEIPADGSFVPTEAPGQFRDRFDVLVADMFESLEPPVSQHLVRSRLVEHEEIGESGLGEQPDERGLGARSVLLACHGRPTVDV